MKQIVSLSGGKDSTAAVLMMLEKGEHIDELVFCDTGKEFPQMYDHLEKLEKRVGMTITILKHPKGFDYLMFDHVRSRGKHKGEAGYGWPFAGERWCTKHLKTELLDKHRKEIGGATQIVGFAYDEWKRLPKLVSGFRYPLIEWKITEAQALRYCYSNGFDWSGLYDKFNRVSCWCCPLQSMRDLWMLYNCYPDLWKRLKDMDTKQIRPRPFNHGHNTQDIEDRFVLLQNKLISDF